MLGEHKLEVLRTVEASELPVREVLDQLEIPRSTYYRWRHHFRKRGLAGLRGRPPGSGRVWNQILPKERDRILEMALLFPEWSSREVSCQVTDRCGFTVSESSVYRILKAEGLIREVQLRSFPAESEYRIKTTRPNQQWQTDATYLLVKNWGWYYLISVLDDFSRRILAWGLHTTMRAGDFSQVVEAACERTGVEQAPLSDRPRLGDKPRTGFDLQRLWSVSGDQRTGPHPGLTLSSPDQREDRTLPSFLQGTHQPNCLGNTRGVGARNRGLYRLLQLQALSRGPG